jgi:steroid 5-alpha reductase family enzyme
VSPVELLLLNLGVALGAMLALWLASLALRDVSIVDAWWGPGFALLAWVDVAATGAGHHRPLLVAALVTLWGLRLGGYLLWRNRGRPEDPRYTAMRRHHGARFPWVSLATVFALQGVLQVAVGLPIALTAARPGGPALGALDLLGAALFAVGLFFESVGDLQLAGFRADPANAGRVMDRGLWAWTRHPNYFGDCLAWWGVGAIALAAPLGWIALLGPALMTFLLLRVSGVALLERSIARRRPGYAEYAARVPAFLPRPPRRPKAARGRGV